MADNKKEDCKYWDKCYQKNPQHHAKYKHPAPSADLRNVPMKPASESLSEIEVNVSDSPPQLQVTTKVEQATHSSPKLLEISNRAAKRRTPSPNIMETEAKKPKELERRDEPEASSSTQRQEMDITEEYNEVMRNLEGKNYFEIFQQRVRYSQKAEYLDLLKTNEFIRYKFLVEMPDEFYKFWDFCHTLQKGDVKVEEVFAKIGLKLVGPFDFLAGKFHNAKIHEPGDYLRHWRFFYDPPEFQTVLVKEKTGIHYGYWRDEPSEKDGLLMARNDATKSCEFEFVGGNCFETLMYYLDKDFVGTPFNKASVNNFKKSITAYTQGNNIRLDTMNGLLKSRDKRVVTKTFHRAGLVVPYDRKSDVGYRAMIESDANLKKILKKFESVEADKDRFNIGMADLQPIITAASIAADECDFGTTVELGIDLFSSGHTDLHGVVSTLLIPGYSLLNRPQFIAISKAHLEGRKRDINLSIFDIE